ncbi:odorant receptor 56a [Topomyia yanbarensis]|uniref:odorant receptor 56a n=1 Tax=Topomyia yanbarensis TaxID=2498891 RepID=UPI00273C9517|nr:odorant receptor 56a [Topomyia yanbarensis]
MELTQEWIQEDVVFENPLLKLALNGLKHYGLLLYKSQPWKNLNGFRGAFFTASMLVFNITQFMDLFQVFGNIGEMTANAATTLLFHTTVVRILHFYWNRTRFNTLIRIADEEIRHIMRHGNATEKRILSSNVKHTNRLTLVIWMCVLITANTIIYYPIIQYCRMKSTDMSNLEKPSLILQSWYPADTVRLPIIYAIQLYIMYLGQLIVTSWLLFIISLMVYLRTVLMVLNHKLSHLESYEVSELRSARPLRKIRADSDEARCELRAELLVECVQQQRKIYDYTRELESLTRSAVFLDFATFSILICALLFEASYTESAVQVFIDICYIMTMIAFLFVYYWHANEISHHANLLSSSAYRSDWYNYPRSVNRHLITFGCFNNKPLTIKAFFVPTSLDTFIAILRASYSYFTILKQAAD